MGGNLASMVKIDLFGYHLIIWDFIIDQNTKIIQFLSVNRQ